MGNLISSSTPKRRIEILQNLKKFNMTLCTFTALVLATLYHGSHQKPSQPSQSSSEKGILVVTGDNEKKTEFWPKPDSQCALQDFPLEVVGAVGFWTAQGPMVCGGRGGENKCFLYREHQWMPSTNMGTAREYASAIQINPNQALIIGGRDENWHDLKTTEVVSSSGSEERNRFPVRIAGHCSFTINAT